MINVFALSKSITQYKRLYILAAIMQLQVGWDYMALTRG
ncbi:hypothetical protein PALB_26520 [Pseudoalteromonas luteoviolacea B = ATCC 29581]|nr:hypothetical protein PALB_26520 [Pseudoalteromonas luteoviolacea B = ATCC 29581]